MIQLTYDNECTTIIQSLRLFGLDIPTELIREIINLYLNVKGIHFKNMIPIKNYFTDKINEYYAWGDFETCGCEFISDYRNDNLFWDNKNYKNYLIAHIDEIKETTTSAGKDYHDVPKKSYNYYFTLHNNDYLFVLHTNIRMNNSFQDKWHWYSISNSCLFYKILKKEVINSIDSDDNDDNDDSDDINNEGLPNNAIILSIPEKLNDSSSIIDKIAYILSYKPDQPFRSGK